MKLQNNIEIPLGIVFRPERPPEEMPAFARRAEDVGFDEVWIWEDCFYSGGIALASAALAATERTSVGLGIMPAVARNAAFAAMEIATLARLYPGRFLPGFGHGIAAWMRQVGAFPNSQLAALEEVTVTVRAILAGEPVTFAGTEVQLADVQLTHPPDPVPPISLGVRGPKSLALSGRSAGGTILADGSPAAYVAWAREQIEKGRREAGRDDAHRLTVYALACAGETTEEAREELRPVLAASLYPGYLDTHLEPLGILPQVEALRQSGDMAHFAAQMPDQWIDQLALAGTSDDWLTAVDRYVTAGADALVLVPLPGMGIETLDLFAGRLAADGD